MAINVPALTVENIHKQFGVVEVLKGISMTANEGDVISILGSSGSGKSTFLRCINLLEIPNQGSVTVHGETIRMEQDRLGSQQPADRRQVERIRSKLGMVFQSFNLWSHMTVLENCIEAPVHVLKQNKQEATAKAEALLQKVGLYERKDYYPSH
ncbi:MAG: ATP-binding cassette domain-containing protein, partial [Candidatus Competibacteraceae bacterium]|nr:ATP-binding cassette domain-containing protein [Candidatus Competibacteraceae bacterium]